MTNAAVWASDHPVHDATLIKTGGRSHVGGDCTGLRVEQGTGKVEAINRRPPKAVSELAALLPDQHAEAFVSVARKPFPNGRVPGPIAAIFEKRVEASVDDTWDELPAAELVRHLLADAIEVDGKALGRKQRPGCGQRTLDITYDTPRGTYRTLTRLLCRSHRCPRCAGILARKFALRVSAQVRRDRAARRPLHVVVTLTLARDGYINGAEAHRAQLRLVAAFMRRLRRRFPGPLAYFLSVETHKDGWPHIHLLLRSASLRAAVLASAGIEDRVQVVVDPLWGNVEESADARLLRQIEVAGGTPDAERKVRAAARRAVLPTLFEELRDCALASGFGPQFDVGPVENDGAIGAELCKPHQVGADLPRHFRRFRASGRSGDGAEASFFADEEETAADVVGPVPLAEQPEDGVDIPKAVQAMGGSGLTAVPGHDIPLPGGVYRVRVEGVRRRGAVECLRLGVVMPEALAGAILTHRRELPGADVADLAQARIADSLDGGRAEFEDTPDDPRIGKFGLVRFVPRGAIDPASGEKARRTQVLFLSRRTTTEIGPFDGGSGPTKSTVRLTDFAPDRGRRPPSKSERRARDIVIHKAPPEAVCEWQRSVEGTPIEMTLPKLNPVLNEHGELVRELASCVEAPIERGGVALLVEELWELRRLSRLHPTEGPSVVDARIDELERLIARQQKPSSKEA